MSQFYNEQAFFEAWCRGVTIVGTRWFGDGKSTPETASSKWDLPPRVDDIAASVTRFRCCCRANRSQCRCFVRFAHLRNVRSRAAGRRPNTGCHCGGMSSLRAGAEGPQNSVISVKPTRSNGSSARSLQLDVRWRQPMHRSRSAHFG
jgi:hypothetical protein